MSVDLEQALLQAIHDNPTDDMSWLVLADWLEEQGDPRAELLRLQHQLRGNLEADARLALEQRVRQQIAGGVRPCPRP